MPDHTRSNVPSCVAHDCDRPVLARGYCSSHYKSEYYIPNFGAANRKPKPRQCPCGTIVYSIKAKKMYCSATCRRVWAGTTPACGKDVARWRPDLRRSPSKSSHPRRWTGGSCGHCGEQFICEGVTAVYCSEACSKRAGWRRAYRRRGEFSISPRDRVTIYERDGWTCQLCGTETSREYSPDDLTSPTLDHIVPRSLQLIPDDSPANLRLACSRCNATRGNDIHWAPKAVAF